jgi:hypothetical protein
MRTHVYIYIYIIIISFSFSPDTKPTTGLKAPKGQGCPRCGFLVYAAEQMISKNRVSVDLHINIPYCFMKTIKFKMTASWYT